MESVQFYLAGLAKDTLFLKNKRSGRLFFFRYNLSNIDDQEANKRTGKLFYDPGILRHTFWHPALYQTGGLPGKSG